MDIGKFNITLDDDTDKSTESNKWICSICGQGFKSHKKLCKHKTLMDHHLRRKKRSGIEWKCDKCGEEFGTRSELRIHKRSHMSDSEWKCSICGEIFKTRSLLITHEKESHSDQFNGSGCRIIRFKSDDTVCRYCGKEFKYNHSKTTHERYHCKLNPDADIKPGHPLSEESRKKISESMKKAHAEGRAHNIGECIWNHEKSYPEKWMTTVIENEFNDKEYEYNFQVGPYKLDFAWPKKMRYIEIDGDQHYRFQECIDKDERRDKYLTEKGWTLLRRSWSCISLDKELFITESKRFIDDVEDLPPDLQYRDKRKEYIQSLNESDNSGISCINGSNKLRLSSGEVAEYIRRKDLILLSGIDMTKFGWKHKVAEKIGITKRMADKTVNRFPEIFKDAYKDHHVGKRK